LCILSNFGGRAMFCSFAATLEDILDGHVLAVSDLSGSVCRSGATLNWVVAIVPRGSSLVFWHHHPLLSAIITKNIPSQKGNEAICVWTNTCLRDIERPSSKSDFPGLTLQVCESEMHS
jgi:hypothetical protein